jgi:hypothetical protein
LRQKSAKTHNKILLKEVFVFNILTVFNTVTRKFPSQQQRKPKSSVRKSIYVSLLQTSIPKMESLEIINYDREHDTIELLPAARKFDIYMETVKKGDIP